MGRLTTHVLDISRGAPASGLELALARIDEAGARAELVCAVTNADGRCDAPLLDGAAFTPGLYEIMFHAAPYYRKLGVEIHAPAFLDQIPIRFGVADASQHYHVPLLLSPYGYSTYRGS